MNCHLNFVFALLLDSLSCFSIIHPGSLLLSYLSDLYLQILQKNSRSPHQYPYSLAMKISQIPQYLLRMLHGISFRRFKGFWHFSHSFLISESMFGNEKLRQIRLINANPICRSAELIWSTKEFANFSLSYLENRTRMEERHKMDIKALTKIKP